MRLVAVLIAVLAFGSAPAAARVTRDGGLVVTWPANGSQVAAGTTLMVSVMPVGMTASSADVVLMRVRNGHRRVVVAHTRLRNGSLSKRLTTTQDVSYLLQLRIGSRTRTALIRTLGPCELPVVGTAAATMTVSPTGAVPHQHETLTITNTGAGCVTVGTEDFDLQVQETDGSWTEVLHSPQSTEVYVLVPGQTVEIVTEIPGRAPPAHYRYLKPVLVIGEPGLTLDAELDVVAPPDA